MEKNVIWAVALSAAVLMLWYKFFPSTGPVPAMKPPAGESRRAPPAFAPSDIQGPARVGRKEPETERALELDGVGVVLGSRGAAIRRWRIREGGEDVDLVNSPGGFPPLATFPEVNFKEARTERSPGGGLSSQWTGTLDSGVRVDKTFFLRTSGVSALEVRLSNPSRSRARLDGFSVGWTGGLGTVQSEQKENDSVTRVLAYPSPKGEVVKFKTGRHPMEYRWAGMDNRYYLFAMLPRPGTFGFLSAEKSKTHPGEIRLETEPIDMEPGETRRFEMDFYVGPKGYARLKSRGLGLEHAVDFGFFGFLGKWALKALNRLNHVTGNYGWAIILLTCGMQVLVLPLSLKSYKATAAMKKLQPKIQDLQKRHKDDSKRMNQEMMDLYRQAGTNPFGGCLPMILQIPIFWAFFTMLRNSYELHGSPWILWIHDLSRHDPYYVLPVVMGGGMFLQQKISGAVGDPNQAKIMMFMPVVFTFMFLKFPSGLVLYWLTNSVLSIASQYWYTKKNAA
ncbi:MAG: hypothetical protein A2636_01310 [Elusimicrobia bacterium RIFCSPHIGHO2_01_FULL_64_10]|nr:MAG: hypothetical protein A2636_01310 [Elusimicrobia bacterium RIFCSPHIGHO2_01_FULL_64_10]